MNDFAIIQNNGRRFTPEDAMQLHAAAGTG